MNKLADILMLIGVVIILTNITYSVAYQHGVRDTYKEAFEHGLMVPEKQNGKIIYRWLELHDFELPEEDPELPK